MTIRLWGRAPGAAHRLVVDLDTIASTLSAHRQPPVRLPRRGVALLCLLASRRLAATSEAGAGWVTLAEIAGLPDWQGARSVASLASQVRREVKRMHAACPGVVEAPRRSQLRGPFRLAAQPTADAVAIEALLQEFQAPPARTTQCRAEDVYDWMEAAEPVWRHVYYHDKPGEALSNVPPVDAVPATDPLLRTLALLNTARRLRDMGALDLAERAAHDADAAAADVPPPIVHALRGQATLQRAWVAYRRGHLDDAERLVGAVMATAGDFGFLRLQGQALNLRSLIWRTRGMYADALRDLEHAARLFVVEGDLQHLFAVYHNLACVVSVEAMAEDHQGRRRERLRLALSYSQRHESYCHHYGVGRNSLLNKLLQIGLLRQLGENAAALRMAERTEALALDMQNVPDALQAHRHRLALLFEAGQAAAAAAAHAQTLRAVDDASVRKRFAHVLREERARG